MKSDDVLFIFGLSFALGLLFYIICLQIAYWWFKIDERRKRHKEIIRLLKKIAGE